MAQKHFYLVRRKDRLTNKKPTYYVRFRDAEGHLLPWRSTGETTKTRAELWAQTHLGEAVRRRENITLEEFSRGFWEFDGEFSRARRDRGFSLSAGYLEIAGGYTRNHILPRWGSWRLQDLTPGKIDAWIIGLLKEGCIAAPTINRVLQAFRTVLGHAVTAGYIHENPAALVKPVKAEQGKRGILTPQEVVRLMSTTEPWADFRHYVINLVALTTGARMGEIRGLLVENVMEDHVRIRWSWEEGHGLKAPKYGSVRDVPISGKVAGALDTVIRDTGAETIVFYGKDKDTPLNKSTVTRRFHQALRNIGISEEERRARAISFHSHRHFLNTMLRSKGVPGSKVRRIAGHKSETMGDWYTHYRAEDYLEVVTIQGELLGGAS